MDILNAKGDSPLSIAAANGFKDLVHFLLSQKAKVNHRNTQGLTPIFQASMNRSELSLMVFNLRYFPRPPVQGGLENLNLRFIWSFTHF